MAPERRCARPWVPLRRPDPEGADAGQMMMLSAVILLIGFVALAGMVARVNQLGTQTGTEGRRAILDEVGPLSESLDSALSTLAKRTLTATFSSSSLAITATSGSFTAYDVGLSVTGTGIKSGTMIASVTSSTTATLNQTPNASSGAGGQTITLRKTGFALDSTTTPTIEEAVRSTLEQLQLVEAGHGFWMDWEIKCGAGADNLPGTGDDTVANSYAVVHLTDGTVWLELRGSITFTRTTACGTTLKG